MTRNTPGKIPITECSSESQHLQKHDGPVVTITACQAADFGLSHVYLQAWRTCKMLLKHRQSDCLSQSISAVSVNVINCKSLEMGIVKTLKALLLLPIL